MIPNIYHEISKGVDQRLYEMTDYMIFAGLVTYVGTEPDISDKFDRCTRA